MILGASILQLPAIQQAKAMGLDVVAVDMNPEAIGFKEEGIVKEVISTIDILAVVEAAKRHHIDGVMTLASDMPMRTVAAVSKELGLVGIDEETAVKATSKALMRDCLKAHHVPIPQYYKVHNAEEYQQAVRQFKDWFIVKPADNSGSRGIYLVKNIKDGTEIEKAYAYSREFSRSGAVMVEEYMRGREVSVETLSLDGEVNVIQITDKITTGAPYFVEMGHTQPTAFPSETAERIREVARSAVKAIGIKNGPSHTEIMVTNEGPKIVELGARLGGDCITTHLVPLSTGVNMVECCIRIALGEKPDCSVKYHKGSAIRYFPSHSGILTSVTGLKEANEIGGVKQVSLVNCIGDSISDIHNSADRIGFVIAQGDDAYTASRSAESALKCIQVGID